MNRIQISTIKTTRSDLYREAKKDHFKMMKGVAKSIFRPMQAADFKDAYLAISQEQGRDLVDLIKKNDYKNIVEFGTSFGISTLFLAEGVLATGGRIITTELIASKAEKAAENFRKAGVEDCIEVRVGDALQTLKNYNQPIDLLLLDGWKDLYYPLFQLLEPCFHANTLVYVDNADMSGSDILLQAVANNANYQVQYQFGGKVALIRSANM